MTLAAGRSPRAQERPAAGSLRAGLLEHGLLLTMGVKGLYGRSGRYEALVSGIDELVSDAFAPLQAESIHLPPLVARSTFEGTGYLESFPDLVGSVHVFEGDDKGHRELLRRVAEEGEWQELLEPGEVVLSPAACHAVYPLCTGRLGEAGRRVEVRGYCFRHEPSDDPARMQAFRMHEVVFLGGASEAEAHRDAGLKRGVSLLERLGLEVSVVPASDPFFGRAGAILRSEQLREVLKLEAVTPISGERPTAVLSANCHREHFGAAFGIERADGGVAHSACVGFGVDRIALALVSAYGFDLAAWPAGVRELLRLPS